MSHSDLLAEWLETNGRMGFATGTVSGRRTRRYHGLLLVQTPAGRVMLVGGVDVWLETPQGTFGLSTQEYPQNVIHPRGEDFLTAFELSPWPTWGTIQSPAENVRGGGGCVLRIFLVESERALRGFQPNVRAAHEHHPPAGVSTKSSP